jgi:hypothetical protein
MQFIKGYFLLFQITTKKHNESLINLIKCVQKKKTEVSSVYHLKQSYKHTSNCRYAFMNDI